MAKVHHPTTDLPSEIHLFHILPRLPAKPILRFMCVCKQWHSFLKTPEFAKMHLHHVTNDIINGDQNNHILLFLSNVARGRVFSTFDCEAPEDCLSVGRVFPFETNGDMQIMTSFHGLVCVGIKKHIFDHYSDLILWNPLTGEYKTLSKDNSHKKCYKCVGVETGLYYTSSDHDYKLLRVTYTKDAYIYSLKKDSWRKVDTTCKFSFHARIPWIGSSFNTNTIVLNDKLYILEPFGLQHVIIRFDIKTQEFMEIATPSNRSRFLDDLKFMVVNGCIHLCVVSKDNKTVWWKMDRYGNWTHVGSCYIPLPPSSYPEWLHLRRNGTWLIHAKARACVYEVDSKMVFNNFICSYAETDMYMSSSSVKYIETLVSPNRYIK